MLRRASATKGIAVRCKHEAIAWNPVATNVYRMVPFTWLRCLFFLGSMFLYLTDVVRSGLGIRAMTAFGNQNLAIDTFATFGPYAYPVQTIRRRNRNESNGTNGTTQFDGFTENAVGENGSVVPQVKVWPYKFDTLSVGLRGLVMELGIKEFPECMLTFHAHCSFEFLSLEQVFKMLDALIDGILARRASTQVDHLNFVVQHQWVDTVEQTLFTYLRHEPYTRFFTAHAHKVRPRKNDGLPIELIDVCRRSQARSDPPSFCSNTRWPAPFPLPSAQYNATASPVKIDEHIALRFARFQLENPELDLELVILTARHIQFIENTASVFYIRDNEEVVVLIRGRQCALNHCETVLVDDYRYERAFLETNIEEMYGVVAFLRGAAQVYVWLRVSMLVVGVAVSTWCETKSEHIGWGAVGYMSCVNLLKVPSHVVVYGTVIPVVLYALAHLIDCYLYHLIVQDSLYTLLGQNELVNIRNDARYITLKMRNIWIIGLLCIVIVGYRTHARHQQLWQHHMGIVGFRGTIMGFLSFTTLFFPFRLPSLRQIDVLCFTWHDVAWTIDAIAAPLRRDFAAATTGPFLELRCFVLAVITFMAVVMIMRVVSRCSKLPFPIMMAQSTVIPYSAGTLWSTTALTGFWRTNLVRHGRRSSIFPLFSVLDITTQLRGDTRFKTPTYLHALQIEKRAPEMWALIRLMNIVMMTNPWVFGRLRFVGVSLFLYRLKSEPSSNRTVGSAPDVTRVDGPAFLLPERIERLYEKNQLDLDKRFELIAVVNSKHLSWHELIMCG